MASMLTCPRCHMPFEDVSGNGTHSIHATPVPVRCPHLANSPDCWECFDAQAFGPGEDYEGRQP